ncbi:MAG: GTP-binding protein [Candidatus Heimdallarchaeota archaeon]|nr:GTP-binding protein [Candidatus Heimdallarchaeota archaeon]
MSHLKTAIRAIGEPINLVFCGLDYAGKTAMYIRLKTGRFVANLKPTLASTMDSISFDEDDLVKATIIDLGGQKALRDLWKTHIENSHVIIYVVDAYDHSRFNESKIEFQERIIPLIDSKPCLIVCNKFDLIKADSKEEDYSKLIYDVENTIQKALNIPKTSPFEIIVTSQKTGYGLPKLTRVIRELLT